MLLLVILSLACAWIETVFTSVDANAARSNMALDGGRKAFRDTSNSSAVTLNWWEDEDTKDNDTLKASQNRYLHSLRSMFSPRRQANTKEDLASFNHVKLPHPLRTDLWEIRCQWRGLARRKRNDAINLVTNTNCCIYDGCVLYLEFDPTGYVRLVSSESLKTRTENILIGNQCNDVDLVTTDAICIGTWKLGPNGLNVQIPFPVFVQTITPPITKQQMHIMDMDFHVNPFGLQPKFTRGIIYADVAPSNPVLRLLHLRPIVATFTGVGIGLDTIDLSYRKRS
jgi:hypothetical protein